MNLRRYRACPALMAIVLALGSAPAQAEEAEEAERTSAAPKQASDDAAQPAPAPAQTPPPMPSTKPVFDQTWATIGLGAGLVPSYSGSNDYVIFPLPLIVGRIGGVGISPNGPGFVLDVNAPEPSRTPRTGPRIAFGPAFRFRNDRDDQIEDAVVERAGELDAALEVGGNLAIAFPAVFQRFDQVTLGVQARWDVLGAHGGMVVEPQVTYRAPVGRAVTMQVQVSAEFVDDSFADYYFTITPQQAAATGLAPFRAEGGLNRIGTFALLAYDLSGNALDGGWSLTGVGGYSRLLGDAADTPFTAERGSANQLIGGLGIAYTF